MRAPNGWDNATGDSHVSTHVGRLSTYSFSVSTFRRAVYLFNMKPFAFTQKLSWVIILLVLPLMGYSQYIRNAANSNYGALQSVAYNPANLVDSRYRFAMTPISVYADANNNYVNIRTPYSQIAALRNNLPDYLIDSNGYPLFENSYVEERLNGNDKQAYVRADVMGPSFLFGLNDKSGIAFTTRTRMAVSMNNLNEDLLKLFMEDYDTNYPGYSPNRHQLQYLNDRNTQVKFGTGAMAWQEFGLSYGAVLYVKKKHFVKGGATLKYLIGLGAAYWRIDELDYELLGVDSIRLRSATMNLAYTSDAYFTDPDRRLYDYLGKNKLGRGMGIDLGVVYEFRPDFNSFTYRMDRRKHEDRTVNKYKLKLGAAIVDFGSINFDNAPYTRNIDILSDGDSADFTQHTRVANFGTIEESDTLVLEHFPSSMVDSSFSAALPASFNLNADYHINDNWYVNAAYVQSLRPNKVRGTRKQNILSVGGRYETRRFEAAANLVLGRFYNPVLLSTYLRYGPLYIGSDNLGGIFTPESTNGVNIFAGVQLPILYNLIPDEDGDGVSDERDSCLGVFGCDRAKGCPDIDDDRVPDYKDKCPDIPGDRRAKGCPDPDEDGIGGANDKCPDLPGDKETNGCPDTDGDGVYDDVDACKDEAGLPEYNGCLEPPEFEEEPEEEPKVEPEEDKIEIPEDKEKTPVTTDPTPPKPVETKEDPKPAPAPGKILTPEDVVDLMNFEEFDYYLILGAYKNKPLADELVKRLNREAGILTYVYYDEVSQMNYVTFGRVDNRSKANENLRLLKRPAVDRIINGHVWWKKQPK